MVGGSGVRHQDELTSELGWFLETGHTKALSSSRYPQPLGPRDISMGDL